MYYRMIPSPSITVTVSPLSSRLNGVRQRDIRHNTKRFLAVRIVRKCNGHITIQEREQRRRVGRVLRPVADAKSGPVRIEVVGEVDEGITNFAGAVGGVVTVELSYKGKLIRI